MGHNSLVTSVNGYLSERAAGGGTILIRILFCRLCHLASFHNDDKLSALGDETWPPRSSVTPVTCSVRFSRDAPVIG